MEMLEIEKMADEYARKYRNPDVDFEWGEYIMSKLGYEAGAIKLRNLAIESFKKYFGEDSEEYKEFANSLPDKKIKLFNND